MKKLLFTLTFLAFPLLFLSQAEAADYSVYCANGKVEVDSRTLDQMKSARGSNVYAMVTYNNMTDANNFAKKMGGIGAKCPKK